MRKIPMIISNGEDIVAPALAKMATGSTNFTMPGGRISNRPPTFSVGVEI